MRPPPAATCVNARRGFVLSGNAFMGHVLAVLISETNWSLAPGKHKVSGESKDTWI